MPKAPTEEALEAVRAAIDAGDSEAVLASLEPLTEGQRKRIAPKLRARQEELRKPVDFAPGRRPPSPQRVAATTACAGTVTAAAISRLFGWEGDPDSIDTELTGRAIAARGTEFATTVVARLLEPERPTAAEMLGGRWPLVRWLIRTGAAERPDDPRYTLMLVTSVGLGNWPDPDGIYEALLADPELLEHELWRLFEVDVVNELDQQRVWHIPAGAAIALSPGHENRWQRALTRLAAEGRIDRERLLDASLAALGRDFRASRIGWHGELHQALEPTQEERAERIGAYAALLSSRVPSVVRFALGALEPVAGSVPASLLAREAPGPLSLREKKYATQMLRLLEQALAREPADADALLAATAHGLAHARPDVQERALALLERNRELLTQAQQTRSAMLGFAEGVAPTLRARVDSLLGIALDDERPAPRDARAVAEAVVALEPGSGWREIAERAVAQAARGDWPLPRRVVPSPELVQRTCAAVTPIESIDELIEVAAVVLEGDASGEDVERLLDGVARFCAERGEDTRRRASALLKRTDRVPRTVHGAWVSSAAIAAVLLRAWLACDRTPTSALAIERVERIHAAVARGKPRALEALPTHAGGWVDPRVLEERSQRGSDALELALAAERVPGRREPVELVPRVGYHVDSWRLIGLGTLDSREPRNPLERFANLFGFGAGSDIAAKRGPLSDDDLRAAGIDDVEAVRRGAVSPLLVFEAPEDDDDPAAQFLRQRYSESPRFWNYELTWAADRGAARWLMSLYPARPDVFFALAATNAHVFCEGDIVYGHGDVVLERALDPLVDLGPAAWFAVAASLLVKAPDHRRLAGDVAVAAIDDGRFDPDTLAEALGRLLTARTGNLRRLSETLAEVARVSDLHGAQVWRMLVALVPHLPKDTRGMHEPLELALQLGTALQLAVDESSAAALGAVADTFSAKSKAGAAARALVEQAGESGDRPDWRNAAAAAVVAWAEGVEQGEAGARRAAR